MRIELTTSSLPRKRSTPELPRQLSGRRASNSLPTAWKAVALPNELLPLKLHIGKCFGDTLSSKSLKRAFRLLNGISPITQRLWGEEDSNLRRLSQQIYSLPRLTASVSPRKICKSLLFRASRGSRTPDRLITNQLLWPTELCWLLSFSNIGFKPVFLVSLSYELRP